MNKAFRIVWSHVHQAFVVVNEHCASRGKRNGACLTLAGLGLSLLASGAQATSSCSGPSTTISTAVSSSCILFAGQSLTASTTGSINTAPDAAVYSDTGFGTISNAGNLISGGSSLYYGDAAISLTALTTGISGTSINNLTGATIQGSDFGISIVGSDRYVIGSFGNAGTIRSLDEYGGAMRLINVEFSSGIDNSGTINGSQYAIEARQSDLGTFNNSGTLSSDNSGLMAVDNSTIDLLDNSGTIQGTNAAVVLDLNSSIDQLDNSGTISGNSLGLGIYTNSSIDHLNNSGTINSNSFGLEIGSNSSINQVDNNGTIHGGNVGLNLSAGSSIGTLENSGEISGTYFGISLTNSSIDQINNSGKLNGAVQLTNNSNIRQLDNSGKMRSDESSIILSGNSSIESVENSGTISSKSFAAITIADYSNLENLDNDGTISGLYAVYATGNASIDEFDNHGTLSGASAVYISNNSNIGEFDNSGTINGITDGILLMTGSSIDQINNSGTITSQESVIGLVNSTAGEINNSGTLTGPAGILIYSNSSVDLLNNSGTISVDNYAIDVSNSTLGRLVNSGTIHSKAFAILASKGSALDNIDITGTTARIVGDVLAPDTAFTVKSAATFTSENAYEVDSFLIENGATLNMGSGSSASTRLNDGITVSNGFSNAGTLNVAAGVTAPIHGDYTQTSTGALNVGVNTQGFGKLAVDGTATLASNARIIVDVSGTNIGKLRNVISATTLNSDGTFNVSGNSQLFKFGAIKRGNNVDLILTSTDGVLDSVQHTGNTLAEEAAKVLNTEFGVNPNGALASSFVGLVNEQQVSDAVSQSLPVLAGSSQYALNSTLSGINRVVQERLSSNSGLSSGDPLLRDEHVWIKPFGSWVDQDTRNGVSGFDANTTGLALGSDAAITDATRLGLAFAYARSDIDSDSSGASQSLQVDTFQLIGYGSHELAANTELNFQVNAGRHNNDGKRQLPFAETEARTDYSSTSAHAGLGLEHTLHLSDELTLVPAARADYTWIKDESYHEKGADALNLAVDEHDSEALILAFESKLGYQLSAQTELNAHLGVGYDLINEQATITSTYAGAADAAFTTRGLDPSPWLTQAGLGLSHTLENGTEVSLSYDAEARNDFLNQGASIKARWVF